MRKDLIAKIQSLLKQSSNISEDQVRSLMILVRKRLELMTEKDRIQYLTLNLFCNWTAHTAITQSVSGLRILSRVNTALVKVKDSVDTDVILTKMAKAVGFDTLYSEFLLFLKNNGVSHCLTDKVVWKCFVDHLIEIIRDVPIAFPPVSQLRRSAKKIYDQITKNPIKPGAGVISITLSRVDYGALGVKNAGMMMCLLVRTEDTTTTVVPLKIKL